MNKDLPIDEQILQMERGLKAAGLRIVDLCEKAGIDAGTWSRWKKPLDEGGYRPRWKKWDAVVGAYNALTAPQAAEQQD